MGSNRSVRPILMRFGGGKGSGVFFLLNKFSRSSEVIQGHRGSNKIHKAYLDWIWWREGGWCVLFVLNFSGSSGVKYGVK